MNNQLLAVIFVFLLSLVFIPVHAGTDDNDAAIFLQKAYKYFDEKQYDSAAFHFEKAGALFKSDQAWQKYMECLAGENRSRLKIDGVGRVGARTDAAIKLAEEKRFDTVDPYFIEILTQRARYFWYAKGNFPEALKMLDQASGLCDSADFDTDARRIPIYSDYGFTYGYSGDFEKSADYFSKALALSKRVYGEEDGSTADRYTDMAFPLAQKSEWEKAEAALKNALEINIKTRGPEHISVLKIYNNLGFIYMEKFDADQAILYINKALPLIRKKFGEDHRSIGVGYMNLGGAYLNKKDYRASVRYSKKALVNLRKTIGEENPYNPGVMTNIAQAYTYMPEPDSAKAYYMKTLGIYLELYGRDHMRVADLYGKISEFYLRENQYDAALSAIHDALDISNKVLPAAHQITATNYCLLADYYAATGATSESLDAVQKALMALAFEFQDRDVSNNPAPENVISTRVLIEALMRKTELLLQLYKDSGDPGVLHTASRTAEVTDRAIDILRVEYQTPDSKELLLSRTKPFYERAIDIAFRLHEITEDEAYPEQAFRYMEKSKSMLLIENIIHDPDVTSAGVPDSIASAEKSLSRAIALTREKIFEAKNQQDTVRLAALNEAFFQKKQDYDLLLGLLKRQYPQYFSLNYTIVDPRLREVQSGLKQNEVMINYFWGDHDLYMLAVTKKGVYHQQIPRPEDIEAQVATLIKSIEKRQYDLSVSHKVYTTILRPFIEGGYLDGYSQMTILPDGILHYFPFEILVTSEEAAPSARYLIHDFTVRYLHTAIAGLVSQRTAGMNTAYLGFSPGYTLETESLLASRSADVRRRADDLEKLPQARKEILASAYIWDGKFYFDQLATEENFKRRAGDAGIIHIASHSIIDDESPMNSMLVFSPGTDKLEDGLLHIYELYNMKLQAQLACLSACNTGFGRLRSGEGVVSLAKGFFYAGVPNVMMSLWAVPDMSTAEIMTWFFEGLKAGLGKSDALREAKLRYLETADENTSDPYYWAAFTMIGDNEPLQHQGRMNFFTFFFIVLALGTCGVIFLWVKR